MKLSATMIQGLMLVMLVVTISGYAVKNKPPFKWEDVNHMPQGSQSMPVAVKAPALTKTYLIETVDADVNSVIFEFFCLEERFLVKK